MAPAPTRSTSNPKEAAGENDVPGMARHYAEAPSRRQPALNSGSIRADDSGRRKRPRLADPEEP